MKTIIIKPNNLSKAIKEMESKKIPIAKIRKEIPETEEDYFLVAAVKIIPKSGTMENEAQVTCISLNKKAYRKFEKNYMYAGYDQVFVLHDPHSVDKKVEQELPQHVKNENEAKIREELKQKYDAELKERLAEVNNKSKEQQELVEKELEKAAKNSEQKKEQAEKEAEALRVKKQLEKAMKFNHGEFIAEIQDTDNFQKLKAIAKKNEVFVTEEVEGDNGEVVINKRLPKNTAEAKNALFAFAKKQLEFKRVSEEDIE